MNSYPAFTFCVVAFVLLIGIGAVLNFSRRPPTSTTAAKLEEVPHPETDLMGHNSIEERDRARAEHARVMNLGNQVDGLLTPLQIEALRLSRDTEAFRAGLPTLPSSSLPPGSTLDQQRDDIWKQVTVKGDWRDRWISTYYKTITPRLKAILLDFGELGIRHHALSTLADKVKEADDLIAIRDGLICMAYRVNGIELRADHEDGR